MLLASYVLSSNQESGDRSGGGAVATQTITTIEKIGFSPVIVIILSSGSGYIVDGTALSHNRLAESVNGVFDDCKHWRSNGHVCTVSTIIQQYLFSFHWSIAAAITSQIGLNISAQSSSREETYTALQLSSGSDVIIEGQALTSGGIIIVGRDVVACAWRFGDRCWWNNNQVFGYWI